MDDKILLRVWADDGSTGIWMPPVAGENAVGQNLSYESLELSDDLVQSFIQWQEHYNNRPLPDDGSFDWEAFEKEGLTLAKKLKLYRPYSASIEYASGEKIQKIYGWMVMADYLASLWDDEGACIDLENIEEDLNGYVIHDRELLQKEFDSWEEWFYKSVHEPMDWDAFNAQGRYLGDELQSRLPEYCCVGYCHPFEETHPPFKV